MMPRILVIEDNPVSARLLEVELCALADVTVVGTLSEAIEEASRHHYDMALLDLGLPDSNLNETMRRWFGRVDSMPTVVVSASADDPEIVAQVEQFSPVAILHKGSRPSTQTSIKGLVGFALNQASAGVSLIDTMATRLEDMLSRWVGGGARVASIG